MKPFLFLSAALIWLGAAAMAGATEGRPSTADTARPPAFQVAQSGLPNSGTVSEAIQAGPYTYLLAVKDGKETWLAIPSREVPVGAEISYGDGAVMKNFHSGTLDRTFDEVVFLDGVELAGETMAAVPPGHPEMPALPPGHGETPALPPGHAPVPSAPADLPNGGVVSEAIDAGEYTYLNVTDSGTETWLAIPRRDIPVGAHVRYASGMLMEDFHSSKLDRTFKEVYFLGGVDLVE